MQLCCFPIQLMDCVHCVLHVQELQKGDAVRVRMSENPVPTINNSDLTGDWFNALERCFRWEPVRSCPLSVYSDWERTNCLGRGVGVCDLCGCLESLFLSVIASRA